MLVINPIIYAEVAVGFERVEDLDEALPAQYYRRHPLPFEAAYLAGQCFLSYRRRGGGRRSPLPDFYIGAHAAAPRLYVADARRPPLSHVSSEASHRRPPALARRPPHSY